VISWVAKSFGSHELEGGLGRALRFLLGRLLLLGWLLLLLVPLLLLLLLRMPLPQVLLL
jgi:hypothetical protein